MLMRSDRKNANNFWQELAKNNPAGFVGLSPMDGVTDLPMRMITAKYGGPEVIFTEFTNVEGWMRQAEVLRRQLWTRPEVEGNAIAQLYGLEPDNFLKVAAEIKSWGFKGIDLNMGCPAKNVAQNGAGAGLIRNKKLAQEIYLATIEGAGVDVAVSIKTRIGYEKPEVEEWLGWIMEELKPAALTIHGRTYRQAYSGWADWESIGAAVKIGRDVSSKTVILGNGDVKNRTDAEQKVAATGVAGVLIGRASFGNPLVFKNNDSRKNCLNKICTKAEENIVNSSESSLQTNDQSPPHYLLTNQDHSVISPQDWAVIALEHARLYEDTFANEIKYSFLPMRKHLAWYMRGFNGASEIRVKLTQTNSAQEVEKILREASLL